MSTPHLGLPARSDRSTGAMGQPWEVLGWAGRGTGTGRTGVGGLYWVLLVPDRVSSTKPSPGLCRPGAN